VLLALGVPEADARGALRFSFGATSTDADVDRVLEVLPGVVERARAAGLVSCATTTVSPASGSGGSGAPELSGGGR
jgi:cysteine desulfurase